MDHPRDGHEKVLVMLDAYLDESGIHDGAKVCIIAGYFGGPGQMKRFDAAWKETLEYFHFPMADFHAKDLLKSRDAQPMLNALAKVAGKQRKIYPVAYGIVIDDFNKLAYDERRFLTGSTLMQDSATLVRSGCPSKPYFVPFQQILKVVTDAAPRGGRAHFYFGLGNDFSKYALKLFGQIKEDEPVKKAVSTWQSRDRLGDIAFPRAAEISQLQAADLLVHSLYLHMQERVAKGESGDFTKRPSGIARLAVANARSGEDLVYQNARCFQKMLEQTKRLVPAWAPR